MKLGEMRKKHMKFNFVLFLTLATADGGKKNSGIIWLFTCSLA